MNKLQPLIAGIVASALLAACGGGGDDEPTTAVVIFKRDAATCSGVPWSMSLYIDGSLRATETLSAGATSQSIQVEPGRRIAQAKSGLLQWSMPLDVSAGDEHTVLLTCS